MFFFFFIQKHFPKPTTAMIADMFLWLFEANQGKSPFLMKSINPATARQLRCGRTVCARCRACVGCLWVVIETNLICSCFRYGLHFSLMSALPASQGWAQQGQRLALTRIKPMKKFEFIGPYLAATCGVLWANGRIGSPPPPFFFASFFSKECFPCQ